MKEILTSMKILGLTLLVCCGVYPLMILALAQTLDNRKAEGSLLHNEAGVVVGSRLIAQAFTSPQYFWPRPSAVDFNSQGAGGSNLAPSNPELTERATIILQRLNLPEGQRAPADLLAASGSGLDPHISEAAAKIQAPRVASARGASLDAMNAAIDSLAFAPGGRFAPNRIVNVLELNLAIDSHQSEH